MSKKSSTVLEKEEEYMRINAELESKTAALVEEADNLLKKSTFQTDTPLLNNAYLVDEESDNDELRLSQDISHNKVNNENIRTNFRQKINEIADKFQEEKTTDEFGSQLNEQRDDNVEFEIQNRYLKAKLRVLQEDNEKLTKDLLKKQEENVSLQHRIKEIEEERTRLNRTNNSQATHLEKTKKLLDESKSKSEVLESQLSAIKKELEQTKRIVDTQNSSNKGSEVRLNRAMEESAKLKSQLSQIKSSQKDSADIEKKKSDQLMSEIRRLERQKSELVQAFRKQMQLIDILKRQKMQIEVAKMLQFTEEEFVKALDWEK